MEKNDDVNAYMENWARRSGLLNVSLDAMRIGWDFPFVPPAMTTRFGIHGYVAAYILPEGFETKCPGVEYAVQKEADYAVIIIYHPFMAVVLLRTERNTFWLPVICSVRREKRISIIEQIKEPVLNLLPVLVAYSDSFYQAHIVPMNGAGLVSAAVVGGISYLLM